MSKGIKIGIIVFALVIGLFVIYYVYSKNKGGSTSSDPEVAKCENELIKQGKINVGQCKPQVATA